MHLAERGYFLIALTALLAIAGAWSGDSGLRWAWCWAAGLLCAGLAWEAWCAPQTRIRVEVGFEQRLLLGRLTSAWLRLQHDRSRAVTLLYARALPGAFTGDQPVTRLVLPAGGQVREHWAVRPVRLGPGAFAPLPARVLGRFGLAWWSQSLSLATEFAVAPDSLAARGKRSMGDTRGDVVRAAAGHGGELFELRDYAPGDPLARIDWKASARARKLISREMSEDQHLEIVVVIDAGRMSRLRAGELDRLGVHANLAARLAEHAARLDDRAGMIAYADRIVARCPPSRGLTGVRRVRDALERLVSDRAEAQPAVAAQAIGQMLRSRSLVVWLTDLADPVTTAALQTAIAPLVRRHVVVCAGIDHAALQELERRPASNWRDPWIAIAARAEIDRVAQACAALRASGALVVMAQEQWLENAVLNTYRQQRRLRRI